MVRRIDEAFGRLLDALRSLDQLDHTIVLFTSDHGCHFKTRNDEYKRSGHDASIRVPTVLHGGPFCGGRRLNELVSHVDLAPTLLDAAGLDAPTGLAGRSILPLVQHRETRWPDDTYVQISEAALGRTIRTRRWKYIVSAPDADPMQHAIATHYVEQALYDLASDSYELENLIDLESHRIVAQAMQDRLRARLEQVDAVSATVDPPSHPTRRVYQRSVPAGDEWR